MQEFQFHIAKTMAANGYLWMVILLSIVSYTDATCNEHCKTCNQQTATCAECKPGYYQYASECRSCEYNCILNGSLTTCRQADGYCLFGCQNGFYDDRCTGPCSVTCKHHTCERYTARCSQGCSDTMFTGQQCLDHCQAGCLNGTCTQDGDCYQCKHDYYNPPKCDKRCSSCSSDTTTPSGRNCDLTDGRCLHGCIQMELWGPFCNRSCPRGCNESVCDFNTGKCTGECQNTSLWGDDCSRNCNQNCLNESCAKDDGRCLNGCSTNTTWGADCSSDCPKTCSGYACHSASGECLGMCISSTYWGQNCSQICSSNCLNGECEKTDGSCSNGCTVNRGEHCNISCPSNCASGKCTQSGGRCTDGCINSKWGDNCTNACPSKCKDGVCRNSTGACKNGCRGDSTWGANCTKACPSYCKDGKCRNSTGACTNGCRDASTWGDHCKNACHSLCKDGVCRSLNGACTNGCKDDTTWGNNCTETCSSNCTNGKCNQTNGFCINGCHTNTLWGPSCNETCGHCESGCEQSSGACSGSVKADEKSNLMVYIAVACGLVVICASLVVAFVATKRRARGKKKMEDEEEIAVDTRSDRVNRPMRAVNALTTLFVQNPIMKMIQRGLTQTFHSRRSLGVKTNKIEVEWLLRTVLSMERGEMEVEFESFDSGLIKPFETATRNDNISKNTYTDIYPYDENRVILSTENDKDGDFINASFIDGFLRKRRYIAAQGPSRQTKDDFWMMVWQETITCIVMLNGTSDDEGQMADRYLPDYGGAETFGTVTVYSQSCENYADFVINVYKVANAGKERKVVHMQYTGWQGGTPPSSPSGLIEFHQKYRSLVTGDENPTVVHCTAGVGRTGVFIALDYLTDEGLDSGGVDVYNCVESLREQRVQMVQTQDQYEFLYQVVAQTVGLHCQLIPSADFAGLSIDLEDQFQKCDESLEFDHEEIPTMSFDQEIKRKDRPTSDIPDPRYRPNLASNKYINAVIQDTYRHKDGIIVTQMPTPGTVADFCKLVMEKNCSTLLMLNRNDRAKKAYGVYWPKKGSTTKYGVVQVTTLKIQEFHTHIERMLKFETKVQKVKETLEVKMIQYRDWEDVNMIPDPNQLIDLVNTVREHMNRFPGRPLLVHCLNGSEQSGLYCVVHDLLEKLLTENEISVINSVRRLKARIPKALPTLDQFKQCYETVSSHVEMEKAKAKTNGEDKS